MFCSATHYTVIAPSVGRNGLLTCQGIACLVGHMCHDKL